MTSWSAFAAEAPELAEAGRRLFQQFGVALLATVAADGGPRMAPVCPVLAADDLYLIVARHTPKALHLQQDGRYVLHAFLGPNDEELQVRGTATLVGSEDERALVHRAATFSFKQADPIFRLSVAHGLWCHWERVGRPDTRAIRRRWSARA
jgi:hypothetical protein